VELFEQIRREYEFGVGTISGFRGVRSSPAHGPGGTEQCDARGEQTATEATAEVRSRVGIH